jgi:CheY-like chemotaxis protein/HPt (histidine-containing phosphotransfer) domain-containing protein
VLVVDDNATNREVLLTELAAWGMMASEAPDGPTALERLYLAIGKGSPYRLLITDMLMPGMDGETLGRIVKGDAKLADTRLVIMTSLGRRNDAGRLNQIGFAACLPKPVRRYELRDCLIAALAAGSGARTAQSQAGTRPRNLDSKRPRILLVEDNITNQQVAQGILKKMGLRCDVAANGREAVEALTHLPYDLVLMDVHMPTMDGLQATRAVRAMAKKEGRSRVPIVAMTASAMKRDRDKCFEAGMDDFIAKPVSPDALATLVARWLAKMDQRRVDAEGPAHVSSPRPDLKTDWRTAEPRVFDEEALLSRTLGDRSLARAILRTFLDDIPIQIDSLEKHLQQNDVSVACRLAHTIRGAAANVGGEALCELAGWMELAGKAGDLSLMKNNFPELRAVFDTLRRAMDASPLLVETPA